MMIVASILLYVALLDNTELENSNIENESTNQSNLVDITNPNSLFKTTAEEEDFYIENKRLTVRNANFELIPEFGDQYNEIGVWNSKQKTIVIVPIFGFTVLGNYALGMQFYVVMLIIPNIIYQYILPQDAAGNPSIVLKKLTVIVSVFFFIDKLLP